MYVGGKSDEERERRAGAQMKLSPNRKIGGGGDWKWPGMAGVVVNAKIIKAL